MTFCHCVVYAGKTERASCHGYGREPDVSGCQVCRQDSATHMTQKVNTVQHLIMALAAWSTQGSHNMHNLFDFNLQKANDIHICINISYIVLIII